MATAPSLSTTKPSTLSFIEPNGGQIHDAKQPGMDSISLVEMKAGLRMKSLTEAKIEGHLP